MFRFHHFKNSTILGGMILPDVIFVFASCYMKHLGVIGKSVQQFDRAQYKKAVVKSLREDNYLGIGDTCLLKAGDLKCLYELNLHIPKPHFDK